jgi:hypothetical protein
MPSLTLCSASAAVSAPVLAARVVSCWLEAGTARAAPAQIAAAAAITPRVDAPRGEVQRRLDAPGMHQVVSVTQMPEMPPLNSAGIPVAAEL